MDALASMLGMSGPTYDALGLPSSSNREDDPSARRARATTLEVLRRDPPGNSTQDRFGQARLGYQNHVYLAINTLMDWMGAATFTVQSKADKTIQKSMGSIGSTDSEWHPVPDEHPAAELFANPNENQTFGDYVAQRTMSRQLFGISYEWIVKDRADVPREMYVLLPQYVQALPISPQYPDGAFQLSIPQPMYGLGYAGYTRIDRRNVLIHRMPNPMFPWDGYSPLTAGGQMCDVLGSVIAARKKANDSGLSIDVLMKLQGAGKDEIDRVKAQIKDRYSGIDRGEKVMVTNSDEIDVQQLSTTPDKMAFGESYKDSINFVLALFGVPPALAGLTESTSYAQLFAAIKQFCTGKLGAELRNTAQFWTQKLIRPAWPGCKGNYEPPSIEDDSERPTVMLAGLNANAVKLNEYRAALNMKPLDGGDVTLAQWNQQFAPAPMPGMEQAPPNEPPAVATGTEGDDAEDAYPHALMQHVLGAFGVDASQQPAGEPQDDPNTAAMVAKSLGVVFRKSVDATGHKHKDKGPGGGQFGSGGGSGKAKTASEDRPNDLLDEAFDPKPKPTGTPVKIPSTPAMDASGEFDNGDTKTYHKPATQADAHPAKQQAQKAADAPKLAPGQKPLPNEYRKPSDESKEGQDRERFKDQFGAAQRAMHKAARDAAAEIPPAQIPVAEKAIPILKKTPLPKTPLAKQQAANPEQWLPSMMAMAIPLLAGALAINKGAAIKLLLFGVMVALHQVSKQPPNDEPEEEPGSDGRPVIRPGKQQKVATDAKGKRIVTDLVPTALPKKPTPIAQPRKAKAGTPKAIPYPKNDAGKGSLPGKIGKSMERFSVADYFAAVVDEECGAT